MEDPPPSATSPAQQQQPPQEEQTPEVYQSDSDSDGSPDVEEAEGSGDDKVFSVFLSRLLSLSLFLSRFSHIIISVHSFLSIHTLICTIYKTL